MFQSNEVFNFNISLKFKNLQSYIISTKGAISLLFSHRRKRTMVGALSSNPPWKEPFTICLEGNIGAGKSTLLRQLNESPLVTVFEENLEKWTSVPDCDGPSNLLQLFYENPKRHAAMFQTYAMIRQHANHLATITIPIKVIERSIHSSFGVFAELFHKQEKLLPVERAVLQHLYSSLKTNTDEIRSLCC
jgi:deoxyadenosine/deoxycytidine kinase